jgi:hypothetical protein
MMVWMGLIFAAITFMFVEFRVLGFSLGRKYEE